MTPPTLRSQGARKFICDIGSGKLPLLMQSYTPGPGGPVRALCRPAVIVDAGDALFQSKDKFFTTVRFTCPSFAHLATPGDATGPYLLMHKVARMLFLEAYNVQLSLESRLAALRLATALQGYPHMARYFPDSTSLVIPLLTEAMVNTVLTTLAPGATEAGQFSVNMPAWGCAFPSPTTINMLIERYEPAAYPMLPERFKLTMDPMDVTTILRIFRGLDVLSLRNPHATREQNFAAMSFTTEELTRLHELIESIIHNCPDYEGPIALAGRWAHLPNPAPTPASI